VHDGLPATLLVDSAAAALMAQGKVDAVVVGADRVVANGDTANKIGTFSHAVAAAAHGIPFFVAAPTTTLDAGLATGEEIEIEQRPAEEITHFKGQRVVVDGINVSAWGSRIHLQALQTTMLTAHTYELQLQSPLTGVGWLLP
jgi:methylthioribose-1-phosphate isomerase